jgi:hypothetical protein
MPSIDSPQPQQSHDLRPSTTDEAPLHPEIRSIVSLATAHTQKIYFAGPLVHKVERILVGHTHGDERWHDVRAQLCGTTLNVWDTRDVERVHRQGRGDPSSSVDITEAVRPPFQLQYLCNSTKPSPPVRLCSRFHNTACDTDVFCSHIHQRHNSRHCWGGSPYFLLPFHPGFHFMGCCLPTLMLGEIAPRRDLYGPSHPHYHQRRQG